ncbi:MAG: hypothetical protein JW841_17900 [Deltaproteobacteria bacterium]|nr:hypothetical protein [Deltaproteobacteria bacterium]
MKRHLTSVIVLCLSLCGLAKAATAQEQAQAKASTVTLAKVAEKPNAITQAEIAIDPNILKWFLCTPPLNSVKAAHGNTDWHIDTANEFLYGVDMASNPTAPNHVPATWTRSHIHVGKLQTSKYYNDSTVTAGGMDADGTDGIDRSMLFFYAGHGDPESWSTLGDFGHQKDMMLGNCGNWGISRYYWQCSCEVFAHGPRVCPGGGWDYSCPQDFDGSADSEAMRNVFERWGPALSSNLRMACGSSTSAYCHEDQTNRIWDNYNNKHYDVADSFIFGLHGSGYDSIVVPLCITTGGFFTFTTPLYDTTFTNAANPSGKYFHIQYLSKFATTAPKWPPIIIILEKMPKIKFILPDPPPFREELIQEGLWLVSKEQVDGHPRIAFNTRTGATYVSNERINEEVSAQLSEEDYKELAYRQLSELGLLEADMDEPQVQRMMIDRIPRDGRQEKSESIQKNVIVTFERVINVDDKQVRFLGEGGKINVQLANDGKLINVAKVWRKLDEKSMKGERLEVKPYERAYEEAMKQLENAKGYKLEGWDFGLEAQAGNVDQVESQPIYRFVFKAADEENHGEGEKLPPRLIKVSAR